MIARWLHAHEPLRWTAQTVVAVAIAFVAAVALRMPEPSWAVFSALFVVQGSVGGTVTGALHRVLGAAVGLALGLLIIHLTGVGEWRTLLSLVLAVGAMAIVASRWPHLQYGLVTVAILAVAPEQELFADSLVMAAEIAVGAVSGALAGAVVLPVAAHRSALRHLGQAIQACSRLLRTGMATGEATPPDLEPLHAEIATELEQAREMMAQSRRTRPTPQLPSQFELLRHVDRLWYTLALVDRLSSRKLPAAALREMHASLEAATGACAGYLHDIGVAVAAGERPPRQPQCLVPAQELVAAVDDLRRGDLVPAISHAEAEALFTLSFAWRQIGANVEELARCAAGNTSSS